MSDESRNNKVTQTNLHVLPLKPKKRKIIRDEEVPEPVKEPSKEELTENFAELALKLESRVSQIEKDLKKNIDLLENDIQKAITKTKVKGEEKLIRIELQALSKQLEERIQKTLGRLSVKSNHDNEEKDRLESIKKLTSHLIKVLSFDFYKSVIERLGTAEYQEEVDPFGMDKKVVAKIKPLFDYLYYRYWRITTTGIENIPNDGRALIVSNHSGTVPYDGAMLKTAIINEHPKRKDARFLVENFVYHMPMLGTFMYRIGAVRACPENAEYLLNAGHLVIVFPEGVKGIGKFYRQRYKLQRFGRGGFIKLCMKTNSPLVPVGIVGAEEIHPIIFKSNMLAKAIGLPYIPITPTFPLLGLLGCIPFPTKWHIHFGKPITFDSYGPGAIEDELLINRLSEKVRTEIQEIIFTQLRKRRSIWMG